MKKLLILLLSASCLMVALPSNAKRKIKHKKATKTAITRPSARQKKIIRRSIATVATVGLVYALYCWNAKREKKKQEEVKKRAMQQALRQINDNKEEALKKFASEGKDAYVEKILKLVDPSPDTINEALKLAARNGHEKVVEHLLKKNPSPDAISEAIEEAVQGDTVGRETDYLTRPYKAIIDLLLTKNPKLTQKVKDYLLKSKVTEVFRTKIEE